MSKSKANGIDRIRNGVLELIQDEKLRFGDKLPTEEKLSERFQVSRPTLREALKLLEQEAIIDVRHGKGRYVAAGAVLNIARPITKFESVSDMVRSHGYEAETRILGFGTVSADAEIAAELQIPADAPVIRVERLRHTKGSPLIYSLDWIPKSLFAKSKDDNKDWGGSIVRILADIDHKPVASMATVNATMLPEEVISMHDLRDFGPALLIQEICYDDKGERVSFARDYHRGSAFSFSFVRK